MRGLLSLAAAAFALGGAALASPASATPFGPATIGFSTSMFGGATYTTGASTGTMTLGYTPTVAGRTGSFTGVTSSTSSGTFSFSNTVGTTITESVIGLFTFTDPSTYDPVTNRYAGTYSFDLTSVQTTWYSYDVTQDALEVSFYLLGIVSGGTAGYSGTVTSISFDGSGSSGMSFNSGTLRNPPEKNPAVLSLLATPIPEPAGVGLFVLGLAGVVGLRRMRLDGALG